MQPDKSPLRLRGSCPFRSSSQPRLSPPTLLRRTRPRIDGDTIDIDGVRVRLEGIDAPQTGQTCERAQSGTWPCGRAATAFLARLVVGREVHCAPTGRDRYGRMLGVCSTEGLELNAQMVRSGLAWAFIKYSTSYVEAEAEARALRLGVWQGPAEPAWDYRARRWAAGDSRAPADCRIKGNISRHGRIYHLPWHPFYDRTRIDAARGERWFCSEVEAQAAGWRAAGSAH